MSLFPKLKKLNTRQEPPQPVSAPLYDALFQTSMIGYIVYAAETLEVIEINQRIVDLFELPAEKNLKGLYMSQVMMRYLDGESPNLETLMNDMATDWTGEALFLSHRKNRFYARVNTNVLAAQDGFDQRVLSILDITYMKKYEQDALAANKEMQMAARSKARFLSSMSHELRTPLNGIIGTSNLILSEPDLKDEVKEHISVIRYSSEHMLGIVNDILDFSKIDADKLRLNEKPFSLLPCLNNIVSAFKTQFREQNVHLAIDYSPPDLGNIEIISDETKLTQVIKNLLSNALKFTNFGQVALIVHLKHLDESTAEIYFEVQDTGIGIAADKLDEIFQPFIQIYHEDLKRKYDGSGLGLTISSQIVNMMGGSLNVKSEPGIGSSFYCTLSFPLRQNVPEPPEEMADHVKKDIRGVRALIVEDNEINAGILRSFLLRWQLAVKEARTGIHALELMKYHKFDVVLMDLEMPEMNGYTTLKRIRQQGLDIPVIAFTATLLDDMNSLITEAGFTDYLSKPFKPGDLKRKLEKYCERKIDYV